ncbi:hypothetical protein LAUMK191_01698 [Mycobacterium attenuatum]|nr:hypothetical protein LAUMK191_01698 [Mycobacterium attenuatum]VBA55429.1 hypothetical protein LAUMK41_01773 [Mycobacterium attenuatum]
MRSASPGRAVAGWVGSPIATKVAYVLIVVLPDCTSSREISRRFETVLCRVNAVVEVMVEAEAAEAERP